MSRLLLLSMLSTTASAGGDKTPPGLEKVCDQVLEDATVTETIGAALEAALHPASCDALTDRGACLFGGAGLYADQHGASSIIPFQPTTAGDPDSPAYVLSTFDTSGDGGPALAEIGFNGKPLLTDVPTDGPIVVEGYLRKTATGRWTHVAIVHSAGKVYEASSSVSVSITKEGRVSASLGCSDCGAGSSYGVDDVHISVLGVTMDGGDDGMVTVKATMTVSYADAGQ